MRPLERRIAVMHRLPAPNLLRSASRPNHTMIFDDDATTLAETGFMLVKAGMADLLAASHRNKKC